MAEQVEEPVDNNSNDKVNNGSTESNRNENNNNNNDEENKDKKKNVDPELFSCLLQPVTSDSDPDYIGIRRLLLYRKAESGVRRRLDWRCNGKGYVTFVITFAGQEIGMVCQATKALPETVGDGFNLRLHLPICSRWTVGLPAGTCEVPTCLLLTEQVSAQLQVIMIPYAAEGLNLHILL